MRLADLDARFIYGATPNTKRVSENDSAIGAQGVMFQCPKCAAGLPLIEDREQPGRRYVEGAHYVRVYFANPLCTDVAPDDVDHNPRWSMRGTTLNDLTLSPSINLDVPGQENGCRWHGYVKKGDAT